MTAIDIYKDYFFIGYSYTNQSGISQNKVINDTLKNTSLRFVGIL